MDQDTEYAFVERGSKTPPPKTLRVANTTEVHKLATAIHRNVEENPKVVLSCVGVQSINTAVKATAVANGIVATAGHYFSLVPIFGVDRDRNNSGSDTTVMRFIVVKHIMGA